MPAKRLHGNMNCNNTAQQQQYRRIASYDRTVVAFVAAVNRPVVMWIDCAFIAALLLPHKFVCGECVGGVLVVLLCAHKENLRIFKPPINKL